MTQEPAMATNNMLEAAARGDAIASEKLLPLVYDELRKLAAMQLAREKPGQTLQATALVHEAWLRLVGGGGARAGIPAGVPAGLGAREKDKEPKSEEPKNQSGQEWESRTHFFAAAAEAMRRILVEAARRKQSLKRGGDWVRKDVEELDVPLMQPAEEVIAVHEALAKLAETDSRAAELVKLRYFAGFTMKEAAEILGIAQRTAVEVWAYARAWLAAEMEDT